MILTACAACAAPLAHTAPQCGRCQTRYCGRPCQVQHWNEGGHKALCKKIKKGGGAEQYHADKKYKEAVAVAVEKCADDTKGQTCYICTQAVHWKTKEGLVRMCACRGTAGFAHVSCLAEQVKILCEEAEENNLGNKAWNERSNRWKRCSLCKQCYHGAVYHALAWACWKTYVGRPEIDSSRRTAMCHLGDSLSRNGDAKGALALFEYHLNLERRYHGPNFEERSSHDDVLGVEESIAHCYVELGRHEDAINLRRSVYRKYLAKYGPTHKKVLTSGLELSRSLVDDYFFEEAKPFLLDMIPKAKSTFGNEHQNTLLMIIYHAIAVQKHCDSSLDEQREAIARLEDVCRIYRQVYGADHPMRGIAASCLEEARWRLSAQEAHAVEDASEKLAQGLRIDGDDESEAP